MNTRSEPFLWIHLAGIALFPALIGLTLISLAVGNSFPYFVELPLLVATGILPILVMQLVRPFDIFSILIFSIQPENLSDGQRQILSLLTSFKQKLSSIIAALLMLATLWLLYRLSPLAVEIADFLPQWRTLGLAIACCSFLLSNLFFQIPLSVLLVLKTSESEKAAVEPYPTAEIEQSFLVPGIKVNKILWFLESSPKQQK